MILQHQTLELFGKMLFEKAKLIPPFKVPNPMPHEACFVYIIQGDMVSVSEVEMAKASGGDAVLMKCGNFSGQMHSKSGHYEAVAIHFYPEVLEKIYGTEIPSFLKEDKALSSHSMVSFKAGELVKKFFEGILFYFENPELVNEELLILKTKELFLLLDKTSNSPIVRNILSNLFSPRTFSFKEVIQSHVYDNLSLDEYATLTNMSLSSFKRQFKKIFKESPGQFFKKKRLEKACELLELSDKSITEIAFETGFSSNVTLSASFQQSFNTSPSAYRKQFISN